MIRISTIDYRFRPLCISPGRSCLRIRSVPRQINTSPRLHGLQRRNGDAPSMLVSPAKVQTDLKHDVVTPSIIFRERESSVPLHLPSCIVGENNNEQSPPSIHPFCELLIIHTVTTHVTSCNCNCESPCTSSQS